MTIANDNAANDTAPDTTFDRFLDSLKWRPIEEYNKTRGRVVLFKPARGFFAGPLEVDIGFFGPREVYPGEEPDPTATDLIFRRAQDCFQGLPLEFDPVEFAEVNDSDWMRRLLMD